jgi:hypothetical protein
MPQNTKEEKADYWKTYSEKNKEELQRKRNEYRLANLEECRRKNRERMRITFARKREESKDQRAEQRLEKKAKSKALKEFKCTPKYKASIRLKKKEIAQANHKRFPNKTRKRGEVRNDGMVFWRYSMERIAEIIEDLEVWLTPEEFEPKNKREQKAAFKNMKATCPKKLKKRSTEYREKNREKLNRYVVERNKNPIECMKHRCRARLQAAIRLRGWIKPCKTSEMLGCDWETLKLHIESQFLPKMNWENRKLWHIDHFHPLGDAKSIEDVVRLSHYTNLRPMWAKDNHKKWKHLPTNGLQIPLLIQS